MAQWEIKQKKYSLLCNMIWVANIFFMSFFLQENGMGYFACAYETFVLFAILFNNHMSDSIGKMMRQRIQKSQGRNAIELFKNSNVLAAIIALLGGLILFFISDFASLYLTKTLFVSMIIRLLIPSFVLIPFISSFKGYFNGVGTAAPGSISELVRRVSTFVSSIFAIKIGGGYGTRVAALLNNEEFINYYMAIAVCFAVFLGFFVELIFLVVTYFTSGRNIRIADRDMSRYHEPTIEVAVDIFKDMLADNGLHFFLRFFIIASFFVMGKLANIPESESNILVLNIGAFYGKCLSVVMFFAMFISYLVIGFQNFCVGGIKRNELKFTREKMSEAIHIIIMFGAFLTIAFIVIGKAFLIGCFHEGNLVGTDIMTLPAIGILLIPLISFMRYFVRFINKKRAGFILSILALIVGLVFEFVLCKSGISPFLCQGFSFVIYLFTLTLGFGFFCLKGYKCRFSLVSNIVIPIGTAALTGIIMMLLNKGLINLIGGLLSFIICFVLGMIGNLVMLLALKNIDEEELAIIPFGKNIIKFGIAFNFFDY